MSDNADQEQQQQQQQPQLPEPPFVQAAIDHGGVSLNALARPMIYELHYALKDRKISTMSWRELEHYEFEIRFGYFVVQGPRAPPPGRGGMQRPAPQLTPQQQQNVGKRWMVQLGSIPQAKRLAPKVFAAKMTLPSRSLFAQAQELVEVEFAEQKKKHDEASSSEFFRRVESSRADLRIENRRVSIDLKTFKPDAVIDKDKLVNLDFGLALCPVDARVAVAKEMPVGNDEGENERLCAMAMEELFMKPEFKAAAAAKSNDTTTSSGDVAGGEKKDADNNNNNNNRPPQQNAGHVSERRKTKTAYSFGGSNGNGILVDLSRVSNDGKSETLEVEFEWDQKAALAFLKRDGASAEEKEMAEAIEHDDIFFEDSSSEAAAVSGGGGAGTESEDEETKKKEAENREKERQQRVAVRREIREKFLLDGVANLVRSATAFAVLLRGEAQQATAAAATSSAPAIREREE